MWFTEYLPSNFRMAMRPPLQCLGILDTLNAFDSVLMKRFKGKPCSVVQVGANDGKLADPLYSWLVRARPWTRRWTGLLIEPIPCVFDRLKANYAGRHGVQTLNAAISEHRGLLKLWMIAPEAGPALGLNPHFELLASADRAHITGLMGPRIEPYLREIAVPCLSLADAIQESSISHVDVLVVDAEGHDWVILKQIDFQTIAPMIVLYEHAHLSPADRLDCARMFEQHGYQVTEDGEDTIAIRHAHTFDGDKNAAGSA